MRVSPIAAVAGLGLLLAACGSTGANSTQPAAVRAAEAIGGPSGVVAAGPNPHGGVGSTPGIMAAVHGQQITVGGPCGTPDACFGPAVTTTGAGATFTFTGVEVVNGLIGGYDQNFPAGTTTAAAMAAVLRNLPSDARATALTPIAGITSSCAFANVSSGQLARLFPSSSAGDPLGSGVTTTLGIELTTVSPQGFTLYQPGNVELARLKLGGDSPSMAC